MVFAATVIGCGSGSPGSSVSGNTVNAGKVLKVGTDANFPPYEYYQAQSKTHTGFDIDLITAFAQHMGYDKVEFVNVEFSKIFEELNAKQYDLAIAGITVNSERAAKVAFTDTYIKDGFKIIVGPIVK
ncbi:MAG: transporter substrate-binding domain-containing protein [Phascolarctobacterium sp.]|nr:transporter substrate-binding domain-containing protein [Phascolarctobacterium sp.]